MNEAAAPYSKIGATYLPGASDQIRVYFQLTDNTIQEVFWCEYDPFQHHQPFYVC